MDEPGLKCRDGSGIVLCVALNSREMPEVVFPPRIQANSLLKTLLCLILTAEFLEDTAQGIMKIRIFRCPGTLRAFRRRGATFPLAGLNQSQRQIELRLRFLWIQLGGTFQVLHSFRRLACGKKQPP